MDESATKKNPGSAARHWWTTTLSPLTGPGRASRAELRRCETVADAVAVEATHELHAALGGGLKHQADRLALIAISLANIREDDPLSAAARFGQGERPVLSALRFQALIRTEDPAELMKGLRRALAQIGYRANVASLARDLMYWGDDVRNRWCFDYYGAPLQEQEKTEKSDA